MGDIDRADDLFPPSSSSSSPKSYALSGKIMLSAIVILFAVVIIMVCLHIYARWYLLRTRRRQLRRARRRTHLVFYIDPNNPPNAPCGLDAAVLKSLPTFNYTEKIENGEIEVLECAVCLSEFEEGERGRLLPKCNHSFHVDCIDMWFHSHSTCPICRAPVEIPAVENVGVEVTDSTPIQPELVAQSGPTRVEFEGTSSIGARRKGLDLVGVTIEVPRRTRSFSFANSDESGPSRSPGFKSPTSRILSFTRILSRERKSPLPSPSGVGTSRCLGGESASELDVELGLIEEASQPSQTQTQTQTPR